jgi:hypothetical protein
MLSHDRPMVHPTASALNLRVTTQGSPVALPILAGEPEADASALASARVQTSSLRRIAETWRRGLAQDR